MIYKESTKPFNKEIFLNPPCAYRGAPFWAWNSKLDTEEMIRQTSVFKKMGFGGYFLHVRTGLDTPYLGDEFNKNIQACVESSRKQDMLAWLYDEDRWPSGFAGGLVTKNKAFRQRILRFTKKEWSGKAEFDEKGRLLSGKKLLARYNVHTFFGKLLSYTRLKEDEPSCGRTWYAYLEIVKEDSWFNNQTYVDTLNPEALEKFADVTYGNYEKCIPDALGTISPAIFTDEPQFYDFSHDGRGVLARNHTRAWTDDFDKSYLQAYGEDVFDRLPEIFFEQKEGYSVVRYRYWDHVSERFCQAFSDTLGKRAKEANLELTGHMMKEGGLICGMESVGDVIRQYRGFGIPGIDMLCSRYEFVTAKQCQSAVHQYGREGMLSELYGISRWDYEFRDYKIHGDWQATLGVTLRVPHLSMMSMKGEAKRDYPASISYQSPWYKKYNLIEDHFGRVATALTGGKAVVDIAMIYPIESMWLKNGINERTLKRFRFNKEYLNTVEWLLRAGYDFDFIDEALFPEQCQAGGNPLQVGKMAYKVVLVPCCMTLRATTVERLEAFIQEGGKVLFIGEKPTLIDAVPTPLPSGLQSAPILPCKKEEIAGSLKDFRLVGMTDERGVQTDNLIYALRERDGGKWLFICHAYHKQFVDNNQVKRENITVSVRGEYEATLYDTASGEITPLACQYKDGWTLINRSIYNQDSLLIRLEKGKRTEGAKQEAEPTGGVPIASGVDFSLDEPNVLVLDHARFALDEEKYSAVPFDILSLDNICRKKCGYKLHGGHICQPWAQEKKPATKKIRLLFTVRSEIEYEGAELALEDADKAKILWNGKEIEKKINGWYVDLAIQKVALPKISKGKNRLEIILPFGENTDTENCFILGQFGVKTCGSKATICTLPEKLNFSDISKQRLPFYGGKLTYRMTFEGTGKDCILRIPSFELPVISARCNGMEKDIAFAPYTCTLPTVKGQNVLEIDGYVSRQNSFGALHNPASKRKDFCMGPSCFRSPNAFCRTRKYALSVAGITDNPILYL